MSANNPKTRWEALDLEAQLGAPRVVGGGRTRILALAGPYNPGDEVFTLNSKAHWRLLEDPLGVLVAELVAQGSPNGSAAFTSTLYVDVTAPSGGDGSLNAPFNTIQEALTAAAANTLIRVAPGTYPEALVWPNTDNLAVYGAGYGLTSVTGSATPGVHTLQWVPPSGSFDRMGVRDLTLACSNNGGQCLYLDGNGTLSGGFANFLTRLSVFENVPLQKSGTGDAAFLRATGAIEVRSSVGSYDAAQLETSGWMGNTTLLNTGLVVFNRAILGLTGGQSLAYTWDNALTRPLGGRQGVFLINGTSCRGSVVFARTPLFAAAVDTSISGAITDTGLTTFGAPIHAPIISLAGSVGSPAVPAAITLALPPIASGGLAFPFIVLSGTYYGAITISSTGAGPAPFTRNNVDGRNGRFRSGIITAGASTDIDLRGATVAQANLAVTGSGAIDRDVCTVSGVALIAGVTAVPIAPPLPPGGTALYPTIPAYHVTYELNVPGSTPGTTAKTSAGFNATALAVATSIVRVNRTP